MAEHEMLPSEPNGKPDDVERTSIFDRTDVDWTLAILIDFVEVNKTDKVIDVTLFVSGLVITGTIVSYEYYCEKAGLTDIVKGLSEGAAERKFLEARSYIHLENTKFFMGTQQLFPTGAQGLLWRGKLSSVDGYVTGRLNATPAQ